MIRPHDPRRFVPEINAMNTNWSKILLFSLISFALGVIICCLCCQMWCGGGGCGRHGSCGRGEMSMHGGHGDMDCCKGEGHGMEGMHGGKGSCCKGMMEEGEKGSCCKGMADHGDADVEVVLEKIKSANFQGDTVVAIEGGTVNIHREGDKMEVKVEMADSASTGHEKKVVVIGK